MKIEIELDAQQESFVRNYIAAILFAEMDNADESGGEPLDSNYGPEDFTDESMAMIVVDCLAFLRQHGPFIAACEEKGLHNPGSADDDAFEHAGRDFWYTRVGHGCGFWDGDWDDTYSDRFDKGAKAFGEAYVEVGDDGKLHYS